MRDEARLVVDCKILGLYKDLYKCKHFLWWRGEIWVSGVLAWAWEESLPIVWAEMGGGSWWTKNVTSRHKLSSLLVTFKKPIWSPKDTEVLYLRVLLYVVNFQPVEMTVLGQGQSQGKVNTWNQAAFLQELLGKPLEDTGTLNQENRHHCESQDWLGGAQGLWRQPGGHAQAVSGCYMDMCVSVQGTAGTELRDTANTGPRAALANPDPHSANPDWTGACKACTESRKSFLWGKHCVKGWSGLMFSKWSIPNAPIRVTLHPQLLFRFVFKEAKPYFFLKFYFLFKCFQY